MLPCARQAKTLPLKGNKHYACANYPLCNNAANLDKHIKSKKWLQTMLDVATPNERIATIALCATCAQAPKCSHPGCPGHVGPSSRHAPHLQFCTLHYNDPCRVKDRDWAICRNASVGCRHLAVKSTGGLCFPCGEKRLPCKHALLGCLARVSYSSCRPPALQSMSATEPCAALKVCKPNHCPFQPNAPGACATPTCSTPVNSPKPSMCQLCQAGRPPCLQICGRRASADNGGLCHLCGPTPVHDDEICERPPAAPTATQPDSSHLPVCSTPRCSNFPHDHSRCLFCIRSLWPCSTPSCKYRTPSAEDGFCLVCQPPEPCRLCATENCMNVVADIIDTLCIPCMAMCPPLLQRRHLQGPRSAWTNRTLQQLPAPRGQHNSRENTGQASSMRIRLPWVQARAAGPLYQRLSPMFRPWPTTHSCVSRVPSSRASLAARRPLL